MFPQGEDRDVRWTLTVMGYYGHLAAGVVSAIVSTAWIVHVCVYVFPDQPPGTFLNGFFVALDSVWGSSAPSRSPSSASISSCAW